METPLLLLLMSLSLFGAVTRRYYLAAIACAALPFVRPDAVIRVLLVLLHSVWYGKAQIARPALAGMLLAAAGAVALTWYFGSAVPHSVTAKRSIGAAVGDQLTWYGLEQWFRWITGRVRRQLPTEAGSSASPSCRGSDSSPSAARWYSEPLPRGECGRWSPFPRCLRLPTC